MERGSIYSQKLNTFVPEFLNKLIRMLKINPLKLLLAFKIVSILHNEIKDIKRFTENDLVLLLFLSSTKKITIPSVIQSRMFFLSSIFLFSGMRYPIGFWKSRLFAKYFSISCCNNTHWKLVIQYLLTDFNESEVIFNLSAILF